jgi:hypothetical protein
VWFSALFMCVRYGAFLLSCCHRVAASFGVVGGVVHIEILVALLVEVGARTCLKWTSIRRSMELSVVLQVSYPSKRLTLSLPSSFYQPSYATTQGALPADDGQLVT